MEDDDLERELLTNSSSMMDLIAPDDINDDECHVVTITNQQGSRKVRFLKESPPKVSSHPKN